MSQSFEIEIKSLLGTQEAADTLLQNLHQQFPQATLVEESSQLNHYFVGDDVATLFELVKQHLLEEDHPKVASIVEHGSNFSVRTRLLNDTVLLVIKASIDDTTSSNGISRMEAEVETPNLTLDELDQLVLNAGFEYQAKWSRQRRAYQLDDEFKTTISLDKNAGYGYLAEFEAIVSDSSQAQPAQDHLRKLMIDLGADELQQDRLERMFAYYNDHWPEYYGTEETFTIE